MGWVKDMIKAWLDIKKNDAPRRYTIHQHTGHEEECILNRLWYRGDGSELAEIYKQIPGKEFTFWGSVPTSGLEIKRAHSGLPKLIIKVISNIVINNYNGLTLSREQNYWDMVADDNKFDKMLKTAIMDYLYLGDGAMRVSFDLEVSEAPILEWFPADKVDYVYRRGRLFEVIFKSFHEKNDKSYLLKEIRGWGYVRYSLLDDQGKEVPIGTIPGLNTLKPLSFDKSTMWAVQLTADASARHEGRGESVFESKKDSFDSFDEIVSQWGEAIRAGRVNKYIPDVLAPKDPYTGEPLLPNPFDNQFIKTESDMGEGKSNTISVQQSMIQSSRYLESYMTFLDLCLQGLLSPATLGIDTKKHTDPNAAYERQMEKATLYTRQGIIEALNEFVPAVVNMTLKARDQYAGLAPSDNVDVELKFSEYSSPSFDSQIQTIGEARTAGIMSVETGVDELWGDSKDEEWKAAEVERLKEEQGLVEMGESAVSDDLQMSEDDADGQELQNIKGSGQKMYATTSILGKYTKGSITLRNALKMLELVGWSGAEASDLLDDKQ